MDTISSDSRCRISGHLDGTVMVARPGFIQLDHITDNGEYEWSEIVWVDIMTTKTSNEIALKAWLSKKVALGRGTGIRNAVECGCKYRLKGKSISSNMYKRNDCWEAFNVGWLAMDTYLKAGNKIECTHCGSVIEDGT